MQQHGKFEMFAFLRICVFGRKDQRKMQFLKAILVNSSLVKI